MLPPGRLRLIRQFSLSAGRLFRRLSRLLGRAFILTDLLLAASLLYPLPTRAGRSAQGETPISGRRYGCFHYPPPPILT
jgi:hypothetical protein